ncbi:ninein-like isoform X2 [Polyodon spathula]|uniref:ninein-like isoform X2 n=1 Tax=Polyodon spathula TaxID=7913 RepID=UPI001B7DEC68|nr:ninein-like isoform X2 [Polyodon spathula]
MDGAQLDEYEVRLKELFDGFDCSGLGSLCQEELSDLCQALHLEEVAPALLRELVQEGSPSDRVHFEQFKDALINVLSTTLGGQPSSEENSQEPDSSQANPKFVKDGKRYGRRSLPEFGESIEGFAEVSETEPAAPEENPQNTPPRDGCKQWKTSTQHSEEYEAEGQLRFWNPDDPGTPRSVQPPSLDWLEERLGAVCEELGVSRQGYASCRQLVSMCEQLGLEGLDDVFMNLDPDGMMSVQDFISGVLRNGKHPTPSASTPYRQLKRHLSTQPFDESGRRTATPSAMTSTIALRLFSGLDDGTGYTNAERLLDAWQEEGIDNCHEILQALDFSLDRKVNLSELTIALENELQITKNGIHQAVLASFKSEIRHLLERVDHEMREKGKLRSDLDKADRLKTQMAAEMDEHHSAIERLGNSNLRKLEQEYRDRLAAVKAELTRERDQIQQQASKQRSELEREVEKVKEEELYLRDRLSLAHKENMRLEAELLEITEKLVESENLANKLQSNLDNILKEKFGDLDPGSAEFFLQEERFKRMRSECEQQCRELQDRIDELQAELEEYSALGRTSRPSLGLSLTEEFDSKSGVGVESDPGLGLEEGHPFNMSLEAEMLVEQLKDQHQQDLASVRAGLQSKVSEYEQQVEELKAGHAQEQRELEQRCREEVDRVQNHMHELQSQLETLEKERERAEQLHIEERTELERRQGEEKSQAQARASELQVRVEALESELERGEEERRQLERRHAEERVWLEERGEKTLQERVQEERKRKRAELEEREEELAEEFKQERGSLEKRHLETLEELTLKHSEERQRLTCRLQSLEQEILEERKKLEGHFNQKIREVEARFSGDQEAVSERFRQDIAQLEERYQRELKDLSEQHSEEKAQWEFEKEELIHEGEGELERLWEALEREKEVASQELILERDLLEKSHKEELNNLITKNHQLQKDLEDLGAVARGKETELCEQVSELQNELREQLEAKAELLAQAEDKAQKLDRLLQQAVGDFEQERSELQSQLCSLEKKTMEAWALVEEGLQEKQELATEIRKLETRIQELELEALTLSEGYEEAKKQNVEVFAKVSYLTERIKELEGEAEALAGLQRESEQIEREEISSTFRIPDGTVVQVEEQVPGEIKVTEGDGEMPEVASLKKMIRDLEKETKVIPQLQEERDQAVKERDDCCTEVLELSEKLQDQGNLRVELQTRLEASEAENLKLLERITELDEAVEGEDTRKTSVGEQAERNNEELHLDISRMTEHTKELEDKTMQVMELQSMYEECCLDKSRLREEKLKLEERVLSLEEEREQRLGDLEEECARSKTEMSRLVEENSFLYTQIRELKKEEEMLRSQHQETESSRKKEAAEVKARKEEMLQDLNIQLEAKIQAVSKLEDRCVEFERDNAELKNTVSDLQEKCHKFQEKSQAHRSEARRLAEENLSLKREISTLKEDGGFSQLKLKDLGETQEEVLRKVEQFKKEKMAAVKAAENFKKQVLELRSRAQQLESENAELAQKSGQNAKDLVELNRRMCEVLRRHENRENGRRHQRGELERERAALSAELSQERSKMAACMSTLESELCRVEERSRVLEQEKAVLSQELSAVKEKLSGSSDLKKELLSVVCKNEKLQKEKEALSEELNRCVDKVAKIGVLENQLAQLRQDRQAVEQHAQTLRSQLSASLDKVHSLEEAVQSVNLQMARLKSDLRVTQQEKEALKQEVMSLHKQLQNANDKNQVLDLAVHSTGYQNQQKKLYWDELARLVEQEQQLLRQENERLQKEVQNTKGDLNHSREKIRQLEAMILTLKQQKQQGQSSLVKAVEQEKSSLKRELEQLHRELLAANRRVSELSDCERELESLKVENETLRSRQARLESQTLCEQLGGLVPREQLVQAQHRLLHGERRGQHRPEDLGGRAPDINAQQEGDVLLRMEERMRNVEQNLRNVKLLLQEKVSQLKDQLHRNTKADEMIKDLYVENAQLLKALEMTENRQKVTEKKNYLLEEKISSLNKIVRDLSPSPLTAVPYHFTRS